MENTEKIQAILNTLPLLTMPPTRDNVNMMLGIYQTLEEIKKDLETEADDDGREDHPE